MLNNISFTITMALSGVFTPINITLMILVCASIFFMRGKVRADLVALCSLLALILTGILEPSEALAGFSSPIVITMAGLFVVGGGIFRTGLAKMISSKILQLAGNNENILFVLIMLVTAAIGAFVSNTGTVAVMMPIVVSMAASANVNSKRYLMPLAFASSMGMFTLISTPPNLVINEALIQAGFGSLSFFSFTPVALIALSVGVVFLFLTSKFLVTKNEDTLKKKKQGKSLLELADEYNLSQNSTKIVAVDDSSILNITLAELAISTKYNVTISKIIRKTGSTRFNKNTEEIVAGPNTKINANDILYCHGEQEDIERFVSECKLEIIKQTERKLFTNFQESGIAEILILPNSRLVNRTVAESGFREEYNVNILVLQRNNEYRMHDIPNVKIHSGDAMLIQGKWSDIGALSSRQTDLVLLGQPLKEAAKVTLDQKAPIAAIIMLLMILTMAFNVMSSVTAVLLASVLMIVTGCLRNMEEAYGNINWGSIVLIAAMLPMSTAFEKTGAAALISDGLISQLGSLGPYALLAGIYFCTSLITMFISNTATAVLFAPIALQASVSMEVSPYPFLFAVAIAASMCFASPFSTPPNALVMSAGRYSFMDFVKIGLPLQIIMGIVMILVLPLLFPF